MYAKLKRCSRRRPTAGDDKIINQFLLKSHCHSDSSHKNHPKKKWQSLILKITQSISTLKNSLLPKISPSIPIPNKPPFTHFPPQLNLSRWILKPHEIQHVKKAATNSFTGTYRGKRVWIKKLRGASYDIEVRQNIMQLMSSGHKNVLRFCGVCFHESNGVCVVTRLMEGGSVDDLMRRTKRVRARDAVRIGLDVCEGLLFVNRHGVAYRDLSRERVLLDLDGNACLGDMGIVSVGVDQGEVLEYEINGCQWLAPEVS